MPRDRHIRSTYAGHPVPRRALYPRMLRQGRATKRTGIDAPRIVLQILTGSVLLLVLALIISVTSAYTAYAQIAASLKPRLTAMQDRQVFQTSRIFDRNGVLLYEFFDAGKRTKVKLADVSPLLINATIAIEDKTFYTNQGVDYNGIARALYQNWTAGGEASGASTITQQVIKGVVLTDEERSYENRYQRKIKEIILAQEMNERYTKNEILEIYLNEIYYGNLAYGIEAASEVYFKTSARDLTLAQAALLAGLPQLPSEYDPLLFARSDDQGAFLPGLRLGKGWQNPDYLLPSDVSPPKWRQVAVLRQMVDEGYITEAQARRAATEDLRFAQQEVPLNAPHFVFYVRRLLEDKYGQLVSTGGLNIYTTLDLNMQRMAEQKAADVINRLDDRNIHNAAVVIMQPNSGQILAMVGSIDYNAIEATRTIGQEGNVLDGQVNVAIRERQPGSSLKPFTYLAAMEKGMTPATVLWDVPTEFPTGSDPPWYAPKNYNGRWNGPVRIRTALANSLNMPAVKALRFIGIEHALNFLDRVGIKTGLKRGPDHYGLSLTLGGGEVTLLELTAAYNTLASNGRYYTPNPILKITDNEGNIIESFEPLPNEQVVDAGMVAIVSDMLSDDKARQPIWGLNSALKLSQPAAVKTGTSEDWRDAWTVGYTPYVTVGVWSGNNNNEPTFKVESIQSGGAIWHDIMEELFVWINQQPGYRQLFSEPFNGPLPVNFTLPDNVARKPICALPGKFGGYSEELFTQEMINAAGGDSTKLGCDTYKNVTVVRYWSSNGVRYCRPASGQNYPGGLQSIAFWDIPETEPDIRVQYYWDGGSAGNPWNLPLCSNVSFSAPPPVQVAQPTATPALPTPEPTAAVPPVANGIMMPQVVGMGENQARAVLAGLGLNVVVDYQTRDRIPGTFDQFAPYVVISSMPGGGSWVVPGTTVVLGVRAPDSPRPAAPPPPTTEAAPPPPTEAPPPPTAIILPQPVPPDTDSPIIVQP